MLRTLLASRPELSPLARSFRTSLASSYRKPERPIGIQRSPINFNDYKVMSDTAAAAADSANLHKDPVTGEMVSKSCVRQEHWLALATCAIHADAMMQTALVWPDRAGSSRP